MCCILNSNSIQTVCQPSCVGKSRICTVVKIKPQPVFLKCMWFIASALLYADYMAIWLSLQRWFLLSSSPVRVIYRKIMKIVWCHVFWKIPNMERKFVTWFWLSDLLNLLVFARWTQCAQVRRGAGHSWIPDGTSDFWSPCRFVPLSSSHALLASGHVNQHFWCFALCSASFWYVAL